jgi:hypothetical protein
MQRALVGKPVIKNLPTTCSKVFEGACRQPVINGPYEHADVVDAKAGVGDLELTVKRMYPSGSVPSQHEKGECALNPVPPETVTVKHVLPAIPGMFLAMPQAPLTHIKIGESVSENNKVTFGKDQKTILIDDTEDGWKYTYTLTVRQ